jgi:hypothetical protein
MARPSDFSNIEPTMSVAPGPHKCESEMIAQNIMVILKRNGNRFRSLPWSEYKAERKKDGNFTEEEKSYFDKVIGYCKNEDTARLFSHKWAEVKITKERVEKPKKRKIRWKE